MALRYSPESSQQGTQLPHSLSSLAPRSPPPPQYYDSRRSELKKIAEGTLTTLKKGSYIVRGVDYDLRRKIEETRQNTQFYHPNDGRLSDWAQSGSGGAGGQGRRREAPMYISVITSTTLDAVRSLEEIYKADEDTKKADDHRGRQRRTLTIRTGVLSCASPGQTGGNFQAGDDGQELALSRSSTLVTSLTSDEGKKLYSVPAAPSAVARLGRSAAAGAFSTHAMVYSPGVTVFRDDIGRYTHPLDIDIISCAAVPAHTVRKMYARPAQPGAAVPDARQVEAQIQRTMRERMARILFLFETRGVRTLVLPAFGAGAFRNKVSVIARLWASLLTAPNARFAHSFDRVIFAVVPETACEEFERAFNHDVSAEAPSADHLRTQGKTAEAEAARTRGLQPKYIRYIWDTDAVSSLAPCAADWTESAQPLPRPPVAVLSDSVVASTVENNPHLFKVVTPLDVDLFEDLLSDHPNPAFVQSVCRGLREGFWPWANPLKEGYPTTHDASIRTIPVSKNPAHADFIRAQWKIEQDMDRFSPTFGPDLLPGMYSMPTHVVPKDSGDLRMINDHSAGPFSLNSMIEHDDIAGYPHDNMMHLGEVLLRIREAEGNVPLVMFKSDIAEAYRLCPVHPFWQCKQVNSLGSDRAVDRCACFGSRGSGAIFISVNSLIAWIARYKFSISDLLSYSDDEFGVERADNLAWSPELKKYVPPNQAKLLSLWARLGVPFKEKKQLFGATLTIIGIEVDPNAMTLSLSDDRRQALLAEISDFTDCGVAGHGLQHPLRRWKILAGWLNWAFNVFPLLKPCLCNVYNKMDGKYEPTKAVWVNGSVVRDLEWAAKHIQQSSGTLVIRSPNWALDLADVVVYCDACLEGMGFWFPSTKLGYYAPVPLDTPSDFISYFEALCVLSALHAAADLVRRRAARASRAPSRILIFTDNTNTVDMFASLRAQSKYNEILKSSVDVRLRYKLDLRVVHVPGDENVVADAISHWACNKATAACPGLIIEKFQPPQLLSED